MNPETQKGKILEYCAVHGSITVREAFERLNINSPTKRISELRRAGYDVQTAEEARMNASGENVKFNRYFIRCGKDVQMMPKNLHIGQKCRFDPFETACCGGAQEVRCKVTGTVAAIYESHGWFSVEYGDPKQRTSFKFCDVGERVSLIG